MDVSLSGEDIKRLLKGRCKIVTYPDLKQYKTIEDLLSPWGYCVLLYMTSANYGHWTCIIQHKDRIEFFDSYAMIPDTEFKEIPKEDRYKYNFHGFPYLTKLLYNSGYTIEYNHVPLQKLDDDVSTCGRHVAVRLLLRHIPLNNYLKIMTSCVDATPDDIVIDLTNNI